MQCNGLVISWITMKTRRWRMPWPENFYCHNIIMMMKITEMMTLRLSSTQLSCWTSTSANSPPPLLEAWALLLLLLKPGLCYCYCWSLVIVIVIVIVEAWALLLLLSLFKPGHCYYRIDDDDDFFLWPYTCPSSFSSPPSHRQCSHQGQHCSFLHKQCLCFIIFLYKMDLEKKIKQREKI